MVVMTAKVNKKRVILVLAALAALIVLICVLAKGGGKDAPAAPQVIGADITDTSANGVVQGVEMPE